MQLFSDGRMDSSLIEAYLRTTFFADTP